MITLAQDARDTKMVVFAKMVLWFLPRQMVQSLPAGVSPILPMGGPPWIANRVLGVADVAEDAGADATAAKTVACVDAAARADVDAVRGKVVWVCPGNAYKEARARYIMKATYTKMNFDFPDTAHSIQLAIKNRCTGDPEIETVQQILLTNKRPMPSISNILRHSARFRCHFTLEQRADVFTTLQHMGWAPQRMSSRHRPYARISLKIRSLLSALAREASKGSYKKACLHNLREIGSYNRVVLCGLLADLTCEHHKCCHEAGDQEDPDVTTIAQKLFRFRQRCNLLFTEGLIFSADVKDTFTAEIMAFLREPQVIFAAKHAVMVRMPPPEDTVALHEPLERMRAIVGNVMQCLQAALPDSSWQHRFRVWALPYVTDERSKGIRESEFLHICREAGHSDPTLTFGELMQILPRAQKHCKDGMSIRQCWAFASREFSELRRARAAVTLLLTMLPSTCDVERLLKVLAAQAGKSRARLLHSNLEDAFHY